MKMNEELAQSFGLEWIAAWNSRDLPRIMSHYSEHIHFQSPYIIRLGMNEQGIIDDKPTLEAYFKKALDVYQDLHFELHEVLTGAGSLVLFYTSVNGRKAAEFMQLDESGKINLVKAHYN